MKGGKLNGVPYNFGKSGMNGKRKCTKDSDSNPSVVSRDVLKDTAIGVGESATKKPSVGSNQSISGPAAKRHSRKQGQEKTSGKGNHNQDRAGSLNEDGQRMLGDFGLKRQRIETCRRCSRE